MKVLVCVGMDEIKVTIKEANADKTVFRGVDKRGSIYQFKKSQIVRKIEEDTNE